MREKLETLSLVDLRAIAKENGIKNLTIMRKKEIIDRILEVTERKAAEKEKPAKRGPGRPRKTEVKEAVTETKTETVEEKPVKRGPGRPRKNPVKEVENVVVETPEAEPVIEELPRRTMVTRRAETSTTPEYVQTEITTEETRPVRTTRTARTPKRDMNRTEPVTRGGYRTYPSSRNDNYRNDSRTDYRNDQRNDYRNDQRTDYRNDQRNDYRNEQRDYRNDQRNDYRNDQRADYRNDYRNDQRTDYRNDQRNDYRNDQRMDYRNDQRVDYRNDQRNDYRNDQRVDYRSESKNDYRTELKPDNTDIVKNEVKPEKTYTPKDNDKFIGKDGQEYTRESLEGDPAEGILEVLSDGYGFIRCANYLPGDNDVYVSPSQIRRFNLKTGDVLTGTTRIKTQNEKFSALLYVKQINGLDPAEAMNRKNFEDLTPIFPNARIRLESPRTSLAMRVCDMIAPIGKGQRGMIVSPPKAGKTTLLKDIARSITLNNPDMHLIILLIDERPEEVTDIKESIEGRNVEVIYSTFDETPEHHKRVSEMVLERAKRLVEHKKDVTILLDSITRLTRAYNITIPASGRTLSGGLDPAALNAPKKFFGAARNMREGGSLTILATALVETGSKMDDVVFEEFKGTGNMELVLDRKLSEKRIFPALDLLKSGTRRDDLLLSDSEQEAMAIVRRVFSTLRPEDSVEKVLEIFARTNDNKEFVAMVKKTLANI